MRNEEEAGKGKGGEEVVVQNRLVRRLINPKKRDFPTLFFFRFFRAEPRPRQPRGVSPRGAADWLVFLCCFFVEVEKSRRSLNYIINYDFSINYYFFFFFLALLLR